MSLGRPTGHIVPITPEEYARKQQAIENARRHLQAMEAENHASLQAHQSRTQLETQLERIAREGEEAKRLLQGLRGGSLPESAVVIRGQQLFRREEEVEGGGRIEEVSTSPTLNPVDHARKQAAQTQSNYSSLAGWNAQGSAATGSGPAPSTSMNVQPAVYHDLSFSTQQQIPSTTASFREVGSTHYQPAPILQPAIPQPQQAFQGAFSSQYTAQNPYQTYYGSPTYAPVLPNAQMPFNVQPMPAVPPRPEYRAFPPTYRHSSEKAGTPFPPSQSIFEEALKSSGGMEPRVLSLVNLWSRTAPLDSYFILGDTWTVHKMSNGVLCATRPDGDSFETTTIDECAKAIAEATRLAEIARREQLLRFSQPLQQQSQFPNTVPPVQAPRPSANFNVPPHPVRPTGQIHPKVNPQVQPSHPQQSLPQALPLPRPIQSQPQPQSQPPTKHETRPSMHVSQREEQSEPSQQERLPQPRPRHPSVEPRQIKLPQVPLPRQNQVQQQAQVEQFQKQQQAQVEQTVIQTQPQPRSLDIRQWKPTGPVVPIAQQRQFQPPHAPSPLPQPPAQQMPSQHVLQPTPANKSQPVHPPPQSAPSLAHLRTHQQQTYSSVAKVSQGSTQTSQPTGVSNSHPPPPRMANGYPSAPSYPIPIKFNPKTLARDILFALNFKKRAMEEMDAIENQPDAKRQAMGTAAVPLRQIAADHPARAVVVPNASSRSNDPKQSSPVDTFSDDGHEGGLEPPVLSQPYIVPARPARADNHPAIASPLPKPVEPPSAAVSSIPAKTDEGDVAKVAPISKGDAEPIVESAERDTVQLHGTTDDDAREDTSLDLPPIAVLDDGAESDSLSDHVGPSTARLTDEPLPVFEKRQDLLPIPRPSPNELPVPSPSHIQEIGPFRQPSSSRSSPMVVELLPQRGSTPSSRQSSMYASPPQVVQQPVASTSATPPPALTPAMEADPEPLFLPGTPDSLDIRDGSDFQIHTRSETTFSRLSSQPLDRVPPPMARSKQWMAYVAVPPAPPHVLRFQNKQRVMQRQKTPQSVSSRTPSRGKSAPPVEEDFTELIPQSPHDDPAEREMQEVVATTLQLSQCRWDGCDAILNSVGSLLRHLNCQHKPVIQSTLRNQGFLCKWPHCGHNCRMNEKHLETHVYNSLTCPFEACQEVFRGLPQLTKHAQQHAGKQLKRRATPFRPVHCPPQKLPPPMPLYTVFPPPVRAQGISEAQHARLQPWVKEQISKNLCPPSPVRPRKTAKRQDAEESDDDVGDTYDFLSNRSKRYSSMLSSSHQGVSLWSTNAENGGNGRQTQALDGEDVANLLLE